jgi:hypothetical protein
MGTEPFVPENNTHFKLGVILEVQLNSVTVLLIA